MERLIFDTNVRGRLASPVYRDQLTAIKARITRRFRMAVSPQTLSELLDGLRKSTDGHFDEHKERFRLMAFGRAPIFLPFPSAFALKTALQISSPEIRFRPRDFEQWFEIVLRSRNRHQLVDGLVSHPVDRLRTFGISPEIIHEQLEQGKRLHRERLSCMGAIPHPFASAEAWAHLLAKDLGHSISAHQSRALATALDAAFAYECSLRKIATEGKYNFSKHDGDWIDYHQLFYLADQSIILVTADKGLLKRVGGSSQRNRVVLLTDFLGSLGFSPPDVTRQ